MLVPGKYRENQECTTVVMSLLTLLLNLNLDLFHVYRYVYTQRIYIEKPISMVRVIVIHNVTCPS